MYLVCQIKYEPCFNKKVWFVLYILINYRQVSPASKYEYWQSPSSLETEEYACYILKNMPLQT